jgi:hypothetical protein
MLRRKLPSAQAVNWPARQHEGINMPNVPEAPSTQDIPEGYRRLEGSERRVRKGAWRLGPADPKEPVLVSMYVRRPPGSSFLTPQVAQLYNLPTSSASGRTIGLLEFLVVS